MNFWNIFFAVTAVLFLYYFLRYRVTIFKFVGEVRVELDKCSWPWDPNQTGSCDWILTHLAGYLTGTALLKLK